MQNPIILLRQFIRWIANIGVTDTISFYEKKKTQLLNLAVAFGAPVNLYFAIKNFSEDRTTLAIINVCLMTGAFAILIINSYQKFFLGRMVLSCLASILFSASAFFFRNGGEYFLLVNMVIIAIYFNEKKFLIGFTIANILLFIGLKIILNRPVIYDEVPFSRVMFNIIWAVIMMVLALLFFKNEQLSYQKQVEEKNHELEELNNTKEKLFSIIAHDLRSPIGQLKSSLELVNKEYITPKQFLPIASKLSVQVDQLHSTLDNLLRWSISQFQGIQAVPEYVSLEEVIGQKSILFLKQSIERKNIQLYTEGLQRQVWADPDHLQLIFRNLVANAIKYSYQDGKISIRAYQQENNVIIEITDNGMGMTADVQESVFSSVAMVSNTGTSNEKGTGLGLKLCKEFIEKNKGKIWLKSEPGKGSTFYVSIPATQ
ncbi:MAG TPA: HAMP domain-containing sensor histidine kinase [Sediminibacterium sp.]